METKTEKTVNPSLNEFYQRPKIKVYEIEIEGVIMAGSNTPTSTTSNYYDGGNDSTWN